MASSSEFQPYLDSIIRHYGKWQRLYTLTDAEGRKTEEDEETPFFNFGLMVQSVVKEEPDESAEAGRKPKEKIERLEALEGLRQRIAADQRKPHVLLIGRPGSGKSTALARLMLELAQEGQVPVLVELRSWQTSVLELVRGFLRRHELRLTVEEVEALLDEQRLVLLVDGVNELPSEAARRDIHEFRKNLPKVSMIFTTRDWGLGGDLGIEKKLEMQPLTDKQMRAFVEAYLPEKAEGMLRQLKGRLRELGQTPLLLWMLCSVFQRTEEIPQNLGEVFRAFTRGYEQRIKQDVVVESDRRLWPGLLQTLAAAMMQGETRADLRVAITPSEVHRVFSESGYLPTANLLAPHQALDDLLKHHLIQRNGDLIEFRHQLIQDYYAAEWLLKIIHKLDDLSVKEDYLNYLKWTEPISLCLGLSGDEEIHRLINLGIETDLLLGAYLCRQSPHSLSEEVLDRHIDVLDVGEPVKIIILGKIGSTPCIHRLLTLLSSEHSWESVRALEEINTHDSVKGLYQFLASNPEISMGLAENIIFSIGTNQSPHSNACLGMLLKHNENTYIQGTSAKALGEVNKNSDIEPQIVIDFLLEASNSNESYVKTNSIRALHSIDNARAKSRLQEIIDIEEKEYSRFQEEILGKKEQDIRSQTRIHLDPFLSKEKLKTREVSITSAHHESEINILQKKLNLELNYQDKKSLLTQVSYISLYAKSKILRNQAIRVLSEFPLEEEIINTLILCLEDSKQSNREQAIYGLRKYTSSKSLSALKSAFSKEVDLCGEDSFNAYAIVKSISVMNMDESLDFLHSQLKSKDSSISNTALWGIQRICSPQSITHLYQATHSKTLRKREIFVALNAIYQKCKFYNPCLFKSSGSKSTSTPQKPMMNSANNPPILNFNAPVGILNTGNIEIKGDQVGVKNNYTTTFPNATEVKIFEQIDHYHTTPHQDPPS